MSKPEVWYRLDVPAPARLAALRAHFQNHKPVNPHYTWNTWRDARKWGFDNWEAAYCTLDQGFNGTGRYAVPVWYAHTGPQFRGERFADEVVRMRHNGYFTDPDDGETARGIIARLPHGRYIAGYFMSMNGERVYFGDVYDDDEDAARAADEHARVIAEQEREYQERWREAQSLRDCMETAREELGREFEARNLPRHRVTTRREVHALVKRIREIRERLATSYKDVE